MIHSHSTLALTLAVVAISNALTANADEDTSEVLRKRHAVALVAPAHLHTHIECLGEEAGIWGTLHQGLEGWAYPFKLFEQLQLAYSLDDGETFTAQQQLAQSQVAEPHLARMIFADDRFRSEQILFVPRNHPGFVILLRINSQSKTLVRLRMRPRLDPMLMNPIPHLEQAWQQKSHAFRVQNPDRSASLEVTFPSGTSHQKLDNGVHDFRLSLPANAKDVILPIVFAAEFAGSPQATVTRDALTEGLRHEIVTAKRHYDKLLATSPHVTSPDPAVNQAMMWSTISLDQLRVKNPDLGYGLVSGYSHSSDTTRPRYAWFFDEPTLASHAFLRVGLDAHVRDAFNMLQSHQRHDGKTVHEINQSIRFQPKFFETYKYAYIHTDGPVYFLAAYGHYYRSTGDLQFIRRHWKHITKTLDWCISRLDASDGLITVDRDDWGTVEVGTTIRKDTQLQAMWIKALREMIYLAEVMNDPQMASRCREIEDKAVSSIETKLWDEETGFFLWGLAADDTPLRSLIPHHAIGIWMGSHSANHSKRALRRMASSDFRTDWGVRSLSTRDVRYSPNAYQTGTVWPVWNSGVIIGDYQFGRHHDAFRNWRSMVDLRQLGALGPMPEVLHGRFCKRTGEGVPHQMFSEVAIQNGFYDGLLGLKVDVPARTITLAPTMPAVWNALTVDRIPFGNQRFDLRLSNRNQRFLLRLDLTSDRPTELHLSPHLPAGSEITHVSWNGKPCKYKVTQLPASVRVSVVESLGRAINELSIDYRSGVDLHLPRQALHMGQQSKEVRLLDATFADRTWKLQLEGRAGVRYPIDFHSVYPPQDIHNSRLLQHAESVYRLELIPPDSAAPNHSRTVQWETQVQFPLLDAPASDD